MKSVAALALVLVACGGVDAAGGHACTAIGCQDGLTVEVAPEAPWPPGDYRFVVDADGATTTCTGSLPLPECQSRAITCDDEGVVMISESGCALPPSQHGFGDLHFDGMPASLTVEVFHQQRSVGRASFTPTYQTVQPNGPECEPTCRNAYVRMALRFE